MKKYIVWLALCLCPYAWATGPSHTTLKIMPLSVNSENILLYKYKMISNRTGGHYLESVLYGTGTFKDGKFTSLQEQMVHGENSEAHQGHESYMAAVDKLDKWFNTPCHPSDLTRGFTACNLKSHAVNRQMSATKIKQKYGMDITSAMAYFLLPGKLYADEKTPIDVRYAFNHLIIAEFNNFEDCETGEHDASVLISQDADNTSNSPDDNEDGYDCVNVTGILLR